MPAAPSSPRSVVVYNLNIVGSVISPFETDTPLVIYANAVLAFPVTLQSFQPVAPQGSQVSQMHRLIETIQSPFRLLPNVFKTW